MTDLKKAVVLLSGGLDSTTVLAMTKEQGYECYALSFNYGQNNSSELDFAKINAKKHLVTEHCIFNLDLEKVAVSSLTKKGEIPINRSLSDIGDGVPSTYVPGRNLVFLSIAVSWAESLGARRIFIGVNSIDYSGYPDCRPEFIESFTKAANLATECGTTGKDISFLSPLINLKKSEIIQIGTNLGVDYTNTVSCYAASSSGEACGKCDSCILRKQAFIDADLLDPTRYIDHA